MDTEMGETGEGTDELKHGTPELIGAKLNGDMNGAYDDEPMDVSESSENELQHPVKKLNSISSSDIKIAADSNVHDNDSSDCAEASKDVPNCEVPNNEQDEVDKCISSNGLNHNDEDDDDDDDDEEEEDEDDGGIVNDVDESKDSNIDNRVSDSMDCDDVDNDNEVSKGAGKPEVISDIENSSDVGDKRQNENSCDSLDRSSLSIVEKFSNDQVEITPIPLCKTSDKTDAVCDSSSIDKTESSIEIVKEVKRFSDVSKDKVESSVSIEEDDDNCEPSSSRDESKDIEDKPETETSVIEIDITPEKKKPKKSAPITPITPRRSSRNLNKQKSYIEKDERDVVDDNNSNKLDDPDVEEIQPQDPLADSPSDRLARSSKKTTIVVSDTKRLAEIAAGSKNSKSGKKEPTLVIIDTNSILSGRGPVPLSTHSPPINSLVSGSSRNQSPSYSVLPITLPTQGVYSTPQSFRSSQTTIKPIPVQTPQPPPMTPIPPPKPPVVLPSLTDDMYVVEAPSFIVPYVYEKPPIKPLKEYVDKLEVAVKELRSKLEKEEKERKEKEEKEKLEKEEKDKKEKAETEQTETDKEEEATDKESKTDKEEDKKSNEKMDVDESSEVDKEEKDKVDEKEKVVEKVNVDDKEKVDVKDKSEPEDKPKDLTKEKEEKQSVETAESTTDGETADSGDKKKSGGNSYFDGPLGKFFMQIGINLVQEHVQTDLLRSQKRKRDKEGSKCGADVHMAINSLMRTLEFSKENNEPFKMDLKKCEFCSFKTESQLVMAHHLETPHMRNYVYRCNFCTLEVRSPHDILFHMEAEHNVRGRLERAPAFHQCPSCPFEDNQKGKLTRHLLSCAKKYRPEKNQEPPLDWEPPAKIPRVPRNRPSGMSPGSALYQAAMSGLKQSAQGVPHPLLPKLMPTPNPSLSQSILNRGRGRPQLANRIIPDFRAMNTAMTAQQKAAAMAAASMRPGMVYRPSGSSSQPQVLLPTSYQIAGNQIYQSSTTSSSSNNSSSNSSSSSNSKQSGAAAAKLLQQPSISITPLPRQQPSTTTPPSNPPGGPINPLQGKPGRPLGSGKATFVICEICDGYIKDLELLRNHMQWIHKVKIHPKMIYNRPPLNCQKCQFRFFTDQGLERHLLGSHGLVTSSMQEAANKGKDGGRCPVCGRVYQWKLLNHVARDHNMSLKPAHLSYKCTVCTATFGMYKQFENHVYSAHSVVAKRVMDKKTPSTTTQQPSTSSSQGDSLLKPLKINDEITIIPQPPRSAKSKTGQNTRTSTGGSIGGGSNSNSSSNNNSSSKGKV